MKFGFSFNRLLAALVISLLMGCTRTPNPKATNLASLGGAGKSSSLKAVSSGATTTFDVDYTYDAIGWDIPDNDSNGVNLDIDVTEDVLIRDLAVEVHITHTYIGDLEVSLVGPEGTTVVLHNRSGGANDDLNQIYGVDGIDVAAFSQFHGISTQGRWSLVIKDLQAQDVGTLDYARLSFLQEASSPTIPPAPNNFLAQANSSSEIHLSWVSGGGSTSGFVLAYQQGSVPPACTASSAFDVGNVSSYNVSNLTYNTLYAFTLCAYNSNGDYSDDVSALEYTYSLPLAPDPINFVARSDSASSINLTWQSGGGDTQGFQVAYSLGVVAPADCATGSIIPLGTLNSYRLTGLNPETAYSFRLCSYNTEEYLSNGVAATTYTLEPLPPEINSLVATATNNSISYSWNSGGGSTDRFLLALVQGTVAPVNCNSGSIYTSNSTNFTITGLNSFTQYTVRVCAQNANSPRDTSNGVTLNIRTLESLPPEPFNVTATPASTNRINLSWSSSGGTTAGFRVAFQAGNIAPADCSSGVSAGNSTSYSALNLQPDTQYSFRVCSITSNNTLSLGITTGAKTLQLPPPNPTNLTVAALSPSEIQVQWQSGGGSSAHYILALALGTSAPANCSSGSLFSTDASSFNITGLNSFTDYSVRICAQNNNTPRDTSSGSVISGRTLETPPPNPSGLVASAASTSRINLNWNSGAGNTAAFVIAFQAGSNAPANCNSGANVGNVITYAALNLQADTQYSFRVCAITANNTLSSGVTSSARTFQLPPPSPTNLGITAISPTDLQLQWQSGGGSSAHFIVALATGTNAPADCSSGTIFTTDATSYRLSSLTSYTDYSVRICSQNNNSPRDTSSGTVATGRTLETPPPNVSGLTASATGPTQLNLAWNSGGGSTATFLVAAAIGSTPSDCLSGVSVGSNTTYTANSLVPGSNYVFRVCSVTVHQTASAGITASVRTPQLPPPSPTQLAATAASATELLVTWQSGGGSSDHYLVALAAGPTAPANCAGSVSSTDSLNFRFTGLNEDSDYSVRVCSQNSNSPRDTSAGAVVTGHTPQFPPPNPANFAALAKSTSQIQLSWTSGGGRTASFVLATSPGNNAPASCANGTSIGSSSPYLVQGLNAGTNYSFRLCAKSAANIVSSGITVTGHTDNISNYGSLRGAAHVVASGTDAGPESRVQVFNAANLATLFVVTPFPGFTGGVKVALGDINRDGVPDIAISPGPGGGPIVKVYSGADGTLLYNFLAYEESFRNGLFIAVGDVDGDGYADMITGPDVGGGPFVRVFSGATGAVIREFMAFDPSFRGGLRVATGDIDHDGHSDIIVTPGTGGGPVVEVFSGADNHLIQNFFAFDPNFRLGLYLASADVDGDGYSDIVIGVGDGGGPRAQVFSGRTNQAISSFFAYSDSFRGGVRVAAADLSSTGHADVITAAGPGGGPHVKSFSGLNLSQIILSFFAEAASFINGVFVAAY